VDSLAHGTHERHDVAALAKFGKVNVMGLEDAEQALGILAGRAVKGASWVEVSIQALCDQAKARNVHHVHLQAGPRS
jgi:hypothetical protein